MRKAVVYALMGGKNPGKREIQRHKGYTFDKGGYTFDVYRSCEKKYYILLNGTGLATAYAYRLKDAEDAVTDSILASIGKLEGDSLDKMKGEFETAMSKFFEQERRGEYNNHEIARREVLEAAAAEAEQTAEPEQTPAQEPTEQTAEQTVDPEPVEEVTAEITEEVTDAAPITPDAAETAEPVADPEPERDPKAARGPVPEKTFIGTTIEGKGWRIFFDGATERTRIILSDDAAPTVKAAVVEAGFYYSAKMGSYNKKLTFKAYRAAKKLAEQLNAA